MKLLDDIWTVLKQFPEYLPGVAAALSLLVLALPLYFGIWYFLKRRSLPFPARLHVACLGAFVLFSGLAFIFYSPLSNKIPAIALNAYLFVACGMAAYTVVPLVDVFVVEYYFIAQRGVYISPPLRKVLNFSVFILSFLPMMHYVLRFNPLALVAIPTIATAGIALALQDTLKAFIAGVGLGQLVRMGDWISFQDKEGRVKDINWARTVLRTMQGDTLFIPNTLLLAQPFLNYSTRRAHRFTLKIGVSYTASPEKVKQAMIQCAENLPEILSSPTPVAQVLDFSDLSVHYALFYWVDDYGKRYEIYDKLATRVWEAFRKQGFEIPFPAPTYPLEQGFHPVAISKPTVRAKK